MLKSDEVGRRIATAYLCYKHRGKLVFWPRVCCLRGRRGVLVGFEAGFGGLCLRVRADELLLHRQ